MKTNSCGGRRGGGKWGLGWQEKEREKEFKNEGGVKRRKTNEFKNKKQTKS
jgi:hypothetical protein